MNNELLKVALSELSVPEITEILHDVLRKHMIREDYENKDFYEKTYAISEVSWGTIEGITDKEPTLTLLGKVHTDVITTNWGHEICQEGKCKKCNSLVSSSAKVAVCPVCESRVSCT